jgi:glycosyltransferase involved in cell wall biosynthesis
VLCLTSNNEGMPNVILEAMAASTPVVATRVDGVNEVVRDGENGLLVAPGDVQGFSRAVTRLLENPELAGQLGRAGRITVEQEFGCEAVARKLAEIYAAALNGRNGGDRSGRQRYHERHANNYP